MSETQYTYSIITDFPNQKLSSDRLSYEIQKSSITISLDYINTSGNDVFIWFKNALSVIEKTTLDELISAHAGDDFLNTSVATPVFISPKPDSENDEQVFLIGNIQTTNNNDDQVILTYQVPHNKTFYLLCYSVTCDGSADGIIKIGKVPLGGLPGANGSTTSNIFRLFPLSSGTYTGEVSMQPNPRKIAEGDDIIIVAVSPNSKSKTNWVATLDFILR